MSMLGIEGLLLVVVVQVALLALLAKLIARRLSRSHAASIHLVWLFAIACVLSLLPIHVVVGGWPVTVTQSPATADEIAVVSASLPTAPRQTDFDRSELPPFQVTRPSTPLDAHAEVNPIEQPTIVSQTPESLPTEVETVADQVVVASPRSFSFRATWKVILIAVYGSGCLVVLIRFVVGWIKLRRWSRSGRQLSASLFAVAIQAAHDAQLSRVPSIRVVDGPRMPLVFGVIQPCILVPGDFESWEHDHQRATLLHEMTHIRRRDMAGQVMAMTMRVVYWFHPACWYLDRQLAESREWATDQQVVRHAMDPQRYAQSLLSIVARGSSQRTNPLGSAITMSAGRGIEDRLKQILQPISSRSFASSIAGPLSIASLAILALATTVRFVPATAQEQTAKPPTRETAAIEEATQRVVDQGAEIAVDESNFITRIQNCDVLTVPDDNFDSILNVSGVVLSPEGTPVFNASVVLTESSWQRLASERTEHPDQIEQDWKRVNDVFARTTTDRDGKFEFRDVRSPAYSQQYRNMFPDSWSGSVVATSEEFGVGWVSLDKRTSQPLVKTDIKIELKPTRSISGRFVTPDRTPISNALVSVSAYAKAIRYPDLGYRELPQSQLAPRSTTDSDGRFEMQGLPEGYVGLVECRHPDWIDMTYAVAIGDDIPLGKQPGDAGYLRNQVVLGVPAEMVADPGVLVTGTVVDDQDRPLAGVSVSSNRSILKRKTDEAGQFSFRLHTPPRDDAPATSQSPFSFTIWTVEGTTLLPQQIDVPMDELVDGMSLNFNLEKGVGVRGRLVADDGTPIADAHVKMVSPSTLFWALTKSDGSFALSVPKGKQMIIFGTEQAGYRLAKRTDLFSANTVEKASGLPHQWVDASDGLDKELDPFVASKLVAFQVIASLPDGKPAVGAVAIIKDVREPDSDLKSRFQMPPEEIDKSDEAKTNSIGRTELMPDGALTDQAFVEVTLVTADEAFNAIAKCDEAVDGVLNVVLSPAWTVEGRVLIDGKPAKNSSVTVSRSNPAKQTANGMMFGAMTMSGHQAVATDENGWYRLAVRKDKDYSVSIRTVEGENFSAGIGYRAVPTSDLRLNVKDFELTRGDLEISGTVVDAQGNPLSGATVRVMRGRGRENGIEPGLWVGHESESQSETDRHGRFHLRKVPQGTYQLGINGPRVEGAARQNATQVEATTGDKDVRIILDAQVEQEVRRLKPVRIETK